MNYLLDTHVLLWWYLGAADLPAAHGAILEKIEKTQGQVALSAFTLWEVAKLTERGRIELLRPLDELLADVDGILRIALLPLTACICAESTRLGPNFHRDPADQLIAATARVHGLTLLTANEAIRKSRVVAVV